jgi:hypothetical protein
LSTRPYLAPNPVITNGDMSQASLTSAVTILSNKSMISYGISWSGAAPVGSIAVQASNDYALGPDGRTVVNPGTWTALTFSSGGSNVSSLPVSGSPGTGFIDIDMLSAYATRLVYTRTSGTGSLQVIVVSKVQ